MTISRRNTLKISLGIAAGAAFTGMPNLAMAAGSRWDFSDEYGANGLTGRTTLYFIEKLKEKIGDEVEITYQGGGSLGYKSVDHFDAVEDGAVPAAITLTSQLSGIDPLFDMTSLPFLVKTPEEARTLWQVSKPEYAKIFDDHDMVVLYAVPNPPSGIHSSRALDTPEALTGLRIRTYDANGTRTLSAAGASPLQVAWADLIPQLSTGALDAVLTSADGGVQLSIWDYLKHFSELNYAMALFMAHANKDAYEALSDDARAAIDSVLVETEDYAWRIMRDSIEESYKVMRDNGMTVNTTPPDSVFGRLQSSAEAVRQEWLAKVGERGERILAEFESAKS